MNPPPIFKLNFIFLRGSPLHLLFSETDLIQIVFFHVNAVNFIPLIACAAYTIRYGACSRLHGNWGSDSSGAGLSFVIHGVCVCGWNGKGLEIKYILRTNLMSHETLYSYIAARDPVRKPRSYKARESYRTAAPMNRARLHYIVHSREPQRLPYLVNEIIFCKYRFQQFV